MKIAINVDYGGFTLSATAIKLVKEKGVEVNRWGDVENRADPKLIEVIEELGTEAAGQYSTIGIVEIPDEATDFTIENYDGTEHVLYVLNGKIHHAYNGGLDEDEDDEEEDFDEEEDEFDEFDMKRVIRSAQK